MDRFERTDLHCPCCGQFEYEEVNGYEVCEVCGWEDDPLQFEKPDYAGGSKQIKPERIPQKVAGRRGQVSAIR